MKCRVKRVYNLVTPREPLVVLANCKIGWPIFLSRLLYIARWQWRHEALRHGALFVSRQHRLCCQWPGRTLMLYLRRTDGFMQCLWNNVYDRWIRSNFLCIWHRTASTTSDWKSSPAKIFHWNSSGERRLKFIAEQIEEDNSEAERTATAMSSTQPPQTCTEAVTKYYKYIVDETDEERKHWLSMLQKATRRSVNAWSLQSKLPSMQRQAATATRSVQCTSRTSFQRTQNSRLKFHLQFSLLFTSNYYYTLKIVWVSCIFACSYSLSHPFYLTIITRTWTIDGNR